MTPRVTEVGVPSNYSPIASAVSGKRVPYNRFFMVASLGAIIAATRLRIASSQASADMGNLERKAAAHAPRGFRRNLQNRSESGIAIIAELKKASPSRGLIRAEFDPDKLAAELEAAGAAALSVLTDEEFFQGSLENLLRASDRSNLPCLRKDFIVDEFQMLEAKANSADAVLLIVAALSPKELTMLARKAHQMDLDVLCEVHDEQELNRALDTGCECIGVNNRDLKTFAVDLQTAFRLAGSIPSDVLSVAESGIHTGADISALRDAGYAAFLVGEMLMKAESPGQALRKLIADASAGISK